MTYADSKRSGSVTAFDSCQPKVRENMNLLVPTKCLAVLATADPALAQRLAREIEISGLARVIVSASGLAQLRELLKTSAPKVIFLDSDLLGGLPLADAVRQLASMAPVLALASLNAQSDVAKLVADDRVDFIARVGDFVPLASALIVRRLKRTSMPNPAFDIPCEHMPSNIGEIFRHEINNPLTGILGNAELVLSHPEHLSSVEIQRLQTVVDLAVRLRESIRRISNTWEGNDAPKAS